jgi:Iron/manganese superoxide dismutases, alpha-hairpin domain
MSFSLPELTYAYDALAPYIAGEFGSGSVGKSSPPVAVAGPM